MDGDGNARKRQRRNAIRPNSMEAQAIRAIADEYTTRTAIGLVENLHIIEEPEEIIIAQMQPSFSFICSAPQDTTAVAAPVMAMEFPGCVTSSTVHHMFPNIDDVPLAECRPSNDLDDALSFTVSGSSLAVATAVPVDESAVCVDDVLLDETGSDVDEDAHVYEELDTIIEELTDASTTP
jgi:hypothetical protein